MYQLEKETETVKEIVKEKVKEKRTVTYMNNGFIVTEDITNGKKKT